MPFKSLPEDILLYINEFSDLLEIVAFSQICKSFYVLSHQHFTLWIKPLTRTRLTTPLFCSPHQDLTLLDGKSLRNIAIQTLRRDRNWSLPNPSSVGAVTSISLAEYDLSVILPIPGTGLFLLYSKLQGHLICWDVQTKKAVCAPLDIGRISVLDISAGEVDCSRYSLALLLEPLGSGRNASRTLIVVEVSFGQQTSDVQLQVTFKHVFESDTLLRSAVFMDKSVVGLLQADETVIPLNIIAFNRSSHTMVHITILNWRHPTINPASQNIRTTVHDKDLYIWCSSSRFTTRYHCQQLYLPYDQNLDCATQSMVELKRTSIGWNFSPTAEAFQTAYIAHPRHYLPPCQLSVNSPYGVLAVLFRDDYIPLRKVKVTHHELNAVFWTGLTAESYGKITIPERLKPSKLPWSLVHLSHSGLTILFMVDGPPRLQLIRYDTQKKTSSVHQLNVPAVDLDRIQALLVDDHIGTVALLDGKSVLHIISFA